MIPLPFPVLRGSPDGARACPLLKWVEVRLRGERLELNKKEFELLKFFMLNAGKVLSREVILMEVWGYEQGETRTLDNHISRLRKMGITNLETVFGIGYKLSVN